MDMLRYGLLFSEADFAGRPILAVVPTRPARKARQRRFCARLILLRAAADILLFFISAMLTPFSCCLSLGERSSLRHAD